MFSLLNYLNYFDYLNQPLKVFLLTRVLDTHVSELNESEFAQL